MGNFDSSRVALVDTVGPSALIRGPMPLLDGQFAYQGIAKASGLDLPGYPLLVVSLIDCTGERQMLTGELSAFGQPNRWPPSYWPPFLQPGYDPRRHWGTSVTDETGAPRPGSLAWWPIEGLAQGQDPAMLLRWPGYNMSGLVDWLILTLEGCPKTAVYVHCSLGADRTGAAIAGYLVKRRGMTADAALAEVSRQTSAGSPNADYVRLVRAYAASAGHG